LSCQLAKVEVPRAVRLARPRSVGLVPEALADLDVMPLTDDILRDAARMDPPTLRSLDAIHLAAARTLGGSLGQIVTYDRRMAQAAHALGLPTIAPGQ
ncbi:MAG TPA: type II toxin-antitoxin system VapC family toxin, partial [Chloroflexota bacterium]